METAPSALSAWESFYVIIGSSAAALTGLQFVVITLVADSLRIRHTQRDINAFGTPTVLHFSVVLLISGILSAPWHAIADPAKWIVLIGLAGLIYGVVTHFRVKNQRKQPGAYQPVLEDLIWYQLLPVLAYLALLGTGVALSRGAPSALRGIAGLALFLLMVAIRNAWDTVTFIAEEHGKNP